MSRYTKAVAAGNPDKSLKTSRTNHTNFGHIDDPSKTKAINPVYIENTEVYCATVTGRMETKSSPYSPEVVNLAEQLKYQHENDNATQSLSDEFYLQYAQRLLNAQFSSKFGNIVPGLDVAPDPKYAQYSYEEIIAMANNGVNIPKEVLAWAKGQQEADVVDYVVVSGDGENSNDESNGESELNKVRAEAKDYAVKSKKAQEDITTNKSQADDLTDQAVIIANEQKSIFAQNSIDKTEEMAKEWKELDKKKKDEGKLSAAETAKYKKLSKQLDKSGEIIKNLEANSEMLDGFLESIDALNEETNEGITTAQKAINAASNLSQIDQPLNPLTKIHAYKIADNSSGMLEDILSNIDDTQLALVTEKIGHDLENIGNETIDDISSDDTLEVVTFANDFVNKSNRIHSLLGIDTEDDEQEENKEDDEFKGSNTLAKGMNDLFAGAEDSMSNPFGFLFGFMAQPQVALLAAATTLVSTAYTLTEATVLSTERILLGKNLKKAKEEDKKLEEEADKAISTYSTNSEKIASNSEKITEIEEKNNEELQQDDETEAYLVEDPENVDQLPDQSKAKEGEEKPSNPEAEALKSENEAIEGENKTLQEKVQKPLDKSAKLLVQNKKSMSKVDSISQVLDADTRELLKLSENTMKTGLNNAAAGVTNTLIASALMAKGMAMLSHFNPYGAYLCSVATAWLVIAQAQLAAYPVAVGGAVTGFAGAATSKIEYEIADALAGEAKAETKESNQLIVETSKKMGGLQVETGEDLNGDDQTTINQEGENNPSVLVNPTEETNPTEVTDPTPEFNPTEDIKLPKENDNKELIINTETEPSVKTAARKVKSNESKELKEIAQDSNMSAKTLTTPAVSNEAQIVSDGFKNEENDKKNSQFSVATKEPVATEESDITEETNNVPSDSRSIVNQRRSRSNNSVVNDPENNQNPVPSASSSQVEDDEEVLAVSESQDDITNEDSVNEETSNDVIVTSGRARSNNAVAATEKEEDSEPSNVQVSNIPQQEVQEHVVKNVAMGMQPQVAYNSFVKSYASESFTNTKSTEGTSETKRSNGAKANKNDEAKQQEKEKVQDPQEGLKSDYGNNADFVNLVVANNILNFIGLGPQTYIFQLLKWAAIVGLSVLDLYVKKGVVDKSAELAEADTSNVDADVKQLIAKSNEIKATHDKNVKASKALAIDFKTLDADTINYQFAMMQDQAQLVQAGRMSQEDVVTDIEDPNAGTKQTIRTRVAGIADKDSKLLSTINEPTSKAQKSMKVGRQSVLGFEGLNEKLTERNENNDSVGDAIITEAAVAAGLITALVATLLACGPWCWGLVGAWAVALAETAGVAATGVAAKLVSDKVEGNIENNTQQRNDQFKRLLQDDKQMLDVRKVIAKASLDRKDYLPVEKQQAPEAPEMSEAPAKKEEDSEGENKDNSLELSKENEMKVGFSKTSLNAEIDPNKPADLKNANENVVAFVRNVNAVQEQSRAAASSTTDASVKSDTTDKSDVKLARFNKSGAIDSKKRAQKVNAASSTDNRRKRR